MRRLTNLWRNLVDRRRVERDLHDELRAALDLLVDEKTRAGMRPEDARRAACLELGQAESLKDGVRDARAGAIVGEILRDVRYAARVLCRNPLFTFTAALSIAIGIGATTAIFTVANGLLLRAPSGVAQPDRLVDIVRTKEQLFGVHDTSYPDYLDIRERVTSLDEVFGYSLVLDPMSLTVEGHAGADRIFGTFVSLNYFTALGVASAAGRTFAATDRPEEAEQPGASPFVVLSHRFWTRRFNQDPGVIGTAVQISGYPFTVVGVAAEGFQGMTVLAPDVWVPAPMVASMNEGGTLRLTGRWGWLMLGARLKPGIPMAQAGAEVDLIGRALEREHPDENHGSGLGLATASPIPAGLRSVAAGFLSVLMGLVALVLVIACANLAGVLLARAAARRREIAVRAAMGAGAARLVRQLLTETTLLFLLGGAAGLLLARGLTTLLVSLLPAFPIPVNLSLPLDGRVVAFTLGLSLVAAILSGLAPARQAAKVDVVSSLKDQAHGAPDRLRLRHTFVVAQVACSLLLVVIGSVLVRALDRVTSIDRGFDPRDVEVAALDLSLAGYTEATGPQFLRDVTARVRALPGVSSVTLADRTPGPGSMSFGGLTVPGAPLPDAGYYLSANWTFIESGYFETLRIPLTAGRDFNDGDRAAAPLVAIVSETAVERFWPGTPREAVVGKTIGWHQGAGVGPGLAQPGEAGANLPPARTLLVVGVAGDVDFSRGRGVQPALYVPLQQRYMSSVTMLARTNDNKAPADAIRSVLASMDPNLPPPTVQALEDQQNGPVEVQIRVAASVAGSVGVVGLLLASIGVYGVTAYVVTRRTHEIGIRLALGASRRDVVRMVLGQGLSLVGIGSVIGLILAAGASQILARSPLSTPPIDWLALAFGVALFGAIGLIACFVPVRRATRIHAMEALRYE